MNLINAANEAEVDGVVALSTDKACKSVNLYGATNWRGQTVCGE